MDSYVVMVEGLESLGGLRNLSDDVLVRARQAINAAARRARADAKERITGQVAFPSSYLVDSDKGRLWISKLAQGSDLEAIIRGRERPTSLARFARGKLTPGRPTGKGVTLQIKPGRSKVAEGTFLMKLKRGSGGITDTQYNLGLAIRTKDGKPPRNAYKPKQVGSNVWLLYGPSVNQVFRTVASDVSPATLDFLERELARLLELK